MAQKRKKKANQAMSPFFRVRSQLEQTAGKGPIAEVDFFVTDTVTDY